MVEIFSNVGMEEMDLNLKDMFGNLFPKKTKRRKVKVPEAFEMLVQEESQRLIDMDKVTEEAIRKVEQTGIIFLDEIDKIAGRGSSHGPDVSREGVQRDLLAHCRRFHGDHQIRDGPNRSHPVHRFRGLS